WDQVRGQVRDQVWGQVWGQVRGQVWDQVRGQVNNSVASYFEANWLAFYRFFHEVFEENTLIHLALFNEMVCGYRLEREEAWLVRKPVRLERDEQGRLHSGDGMCIQYAGGWGFYAWHGVRVPERIILQPGALTRQDWMSEENLEVRRAIQERLGTDRFVELVGGKCIDAGKR